MKFNARISQSILFLMVSLCVLCGAQAVLAETIELTFAHPYSSQHPQQTEAFEPWARQVEELSGGRLKITFVTDGAMGKPGQTYNVVEKGIADMGWDVSDYNFDKFPLTSVFEIPFMIESAEQGSVAMWRSYSKSKGLQNEYSNMKLLKLSCTAPAVLATTNKPIMRLEDLKGIVFNSNSGYIFDALTAYGAKGEAFPITEYYKLLQLGVMGGVVLPFDGLYVFKLQELLKFYTPVKFTVNNFWAGMNKEKYDSLPADLKKIIDDTSGEALSRQCGRVFNQGSDYGEQLGVKAGMKKVDISAEELAKLKAVKKTLQDKWLKEMAAQGLSGNEVLATALSELEKALQ